MKIWAAACLLILTGCSILSGPQGGRPEETPAVDIPVQAQAQAQAPGARQAVWLPGGGQVALAGQTSVALVQPAPVVTGEDQGLRPQAVQSQALDQAQSPGLLTSAKQQPVLAWVSNDSEVVVWNQAAGAPQPAGQSDQPVTGLAVSPDGGRVAYVTYDGRLVIGPAAVGSAPDAQSAPRAFKAPTWLTNLSFSPDGKLIGGTDPASFTVYVLDAASGQTVRTYDWGGSPTPALYGAFFAPGWQRLAWVAQGVVQVMDASSGQPGALLNHADAVTALAWSPDDLHIATASAVNVDGVLSPAVLIWDARTGDLLRTIPQTSAAQSLSYSADGRLAVLDSAGSLQVYDAK